MKKLNNLATLLAIASILSCCTHHGEYIHQREDNIPIAYSLDEGEHLSAQQAARDATSLMDTFFGSPLRGGERKVGTIEAIGATSVLRSDNRKPTEPLVYIVNFADNKGYAILSATQGVEPIWSVCPVGNLDPSSITVETYQQFLLEQIEVSYNVSRYKQEHSLAIIGQTPVNDSTMAEFNDRPLNTQYRYDYGNWEIAPGTKYECLIPVVWGQTDSPYADLTKPTTGSRHAGCVTAAVAQIMAYHRYPNWYLWDLMLRHKAISSPDSTYTKAFPEIARLYRDLGIKLKVRYGKDGSPAPDSNVPRTFRAFKYRNSGYTVPYSYEVAKSEIKGESGIGHPVYISGCAIKYEHAKRFLLWKWKKTSYDECHAFVLDGICQARREILKIDKKTNQVVERRYEYQDMIRANMGWNESLHNGYYNNSIFDTNHGPILQTMSKEKYGSKGAYQYCLDLIIDIQP